MIGIFGLIGAVLMFLFRWLFAWAICPWCGKSFPLTGKHAKGHCKNCGRAI